MELPERPGESAGHADDLWNSRPVSVLFYSFDCAEPMHVHVERDRAACKFWLNPVSLASNRGFAAHETNRIRKLVSGYREAIRHAWIEHCTAT